MNEYRKQVKSKNKFREFVRVLNGLLQLTERELEVFSLLIKIDATWPASLSQHKHITSTDSRRAIMKETLINKSNLTKYIKEFTSKGLLIKDSEGRHQVNPIFMPKSDGGKIQLLFTLEHE